MNGVLMRLLTLVRQHSLRAGLVIVAVLFAFFVWPTPYRIEHVVTDGAERVYRVNRVTGYWDDITPIRTMTR